ncbi:MAG: NUDIX domain-containing protein, partial [Verrucomicrobiota bacterium]
LPIATVGAMILNPEIKLLMVRTFKWSNLWGIPGGEIQTGETSVHALHREIMEETALEIHDVRFVLVQDCILTEEFYKPAHFILLNYLAHTKSSHVTLNEEADEYRWVTIEEAYNLPLNSATRYLLDQLQEKSLLP